MLKKNPMRLGKCDLSVYGVFLYVFDVNILRDDFIYTLINRKYPVYEVYKGVIFKQDVLNIIRLNRLIAHSIVTFPSPSAWHISLFFR